MAEVLQKIIASSSNLSRRQAETAIKRGEVLINKKVAKLGDRAELGNDEIKLNGKVLTKAPGLVYLKLNKPKGYTCSNRTFKNEKNIFELINEKTKLFSIGRLDKDSHGLILLSNDGELGHKLSHPKFEHEKVYLVKIKSEGDKYIPLKRADDICKKLKQGIFIPEEKQILKAKGVSYEKHNTFRITLIEGKKRQIRRMFSGLNEEVLDLERVAFCGIKLNNLNVGEYKALNQKEIDVIRRQ